MKRFNDCQSPMVGRPNILMMMCSGDEDELDYYLPYYFRDRTDD